MVEAGFRFAIESVRYYEPAMWFNVAGIHATFNHLIAIALFILGVIVVLNTRRRTRSVQMPEALTGDSSMKSP
jgi:prolipoprotein diacylglyceryltransferase